MATTACFHAPERHVAKVQTNKQTNKNHQDKVPWSFARHVADMSNLRGGGYRLGILHLVLYISNFFVLIFNFLLIEKLYNEDKNTSVNRNR